MSRMDSLRSVVLLGALPLLVFAAGCAPNRQKITRETTETYRSAETLASRLQMRVTQQSPLGATMTDGRNSVTIFTGSNGYIYLNGQRLGQPNNAIYENGKVWVMADREALIQWEMRRLQPTERPSVPLPGPTKPIRATIVVDAGHGGKDPGTLAGGQGSASEKTIVLDIARHLQRFLTQRGARVVMTRTSDVFVELDDRCAVAERTRADLLVAIHVNSAQRADASGAVIYVGRTASTESERIARSIDAALRKSGMECNGVQRKGLRVCDGHSRPAVLVECGFMSNTGDARRLNSAEYRMTVAMAIADGIARHFAR